MFDDGQHHPKWSFVRGWNERHCTCAACSPALQFRPQPNMIPYLPVQTQPFHQPQFYGSLNANAASGTTNVK